MDIYKKLLKEHYILNWGDDFKERKWNYGPINELYNQFTILEFAPTNKRDMWAYTTCGMSTFDHEAPIELHLFSSVQDDLILELLASVAHYHKVDHNLNLNHTVNFGKSWQGTSRCTYGLISLPYLDGPDLEVLHPGGNNKTISCYWMIPITAQERDYKMQYGLDALEEKFDERQFNYLDAERESVV